MKSIRWSFVGLGLVGLLLRIFYAFQQPIAHPDQGRIYFQAFKFYQTGILSPVGAQVVYSQTSLPGSLLCVLTGLPLFISQGEQWGPQLMVALLNFLAFCGFAKILLRWFPHWNAGWVWSFLMLAPWPVYYNSIWNPSYLPALFIVFLISLTSFTPIFWRSFSLGFSLMAVMQLHLSGLVWWLWVVLLILSQKGVRAFWSFRGVLIGGVFGGLSLIPYLFSRWEAWRNVSATVPGGNFVSSNILMRFHFDFLIQFFEHFSRFFSRFLSFSTGEIFRFSGHGLGDSLLILVKQVWLIPFLVVNLLVSGFLIVLSFLFFWKFLKTFFQAMIRERSFFLVSSEKQVRLLAWGFPLLTGGSFFFSIKAPSAHTFWFLVPLSFFILFDQLHESSLLKKSFFKKYASWGGVIFLFSAQVCLGWITFHQVKDSLWGPEDFSRSKAEGFVRGDYPEPVSLRFLDQERSFPVIFLRDHFEWFPWACTELQGEGSVGVNFHSASDGKGSRGHGLVADAVGRAEESPGASEEPT